MKLVPYRSEDADSAYKYFYEQSGRGLPPVFSGARYQRGHGLGNVLSGLMKAALPVVKRGAISLGKTALQTGLNIAKDKMSGKTMKQAFSDNVKQAGRQLASKAFNHVTNSRKRPPSTHSAYKSKRRKMTNSTKTRRKRAKAPKDIFS